MSELEKFQFLIGRLRTRTQRSIWFLEFSVSIPYRQAKNYRVYQSWEDFLKFQFLIGRLRTNTQPMGKVVEIVSIPYRQAKNWFYQDTECKEPQVSIPYRQAKNWQDITLKNMKKWRVSIPYRQAKNLSKLKIGGIK